jgi:hypothetical protein
LGTSLPSDVYLGTNLWETSNPGVACKAPCVLVSCCSVFHPF